jgi:hypothetical protein
MTVFRSVVIDKGRKHIGSVVIKRRNGENVASEMPIHVKNPKTIGQTDQRQAFTASIDFCKKMSEVAAYGFTGVKKGSTRMNGLMKDVIKNHLTGIAGSKVVDYPNVIVTRGSLINETGMVVTNPAAGNIICTYPNSADTGNAKASDILSVAIYNKTKKECIFQNTGSERSASPYTLPYQTSMAGDDVEIYTMFKSVNGKLVTTSFYAGDFTLK